MWPIGLASALSCLIAPRFGMLVHVIYALSDLNSPPEPKPADFMDI